MDTFSLWQLAALAAASTLVGFSKTAVSGANTISLAVFAAVLPARESTGVLLPILIAGDVLAVLVYRRHAHWPTLLRLFPAVAVGVAAGTVFMMWADDDAVRTSIGAILLLMAGVTLWRRREGPQPSPDEEGSGPPSRGERLKARSYGVLGGFTTMVANAGGPVMSLYLLSAGFRKLGFLGTSAWFFLIVNTSKVPFSAGLGLIDARSLLLDAALVLFVVPGALLGRACIGRINQKIFDRIVIGATVLGGLQLLLG
ncbi:MULTISPECIES: sulfite exporter TauE/SafE family protein [Streptomyces]|uniref:sulfite exporter TauE/SafE family protein n=1 Tax=Streptomyces TaxID=1883 RepID=UPI00227272C9|nr:MULTISPECIES: sulfite exporter TauE/SafE family protein [unclassified Streptomyces]MDF9868759.1 putative membrane protein YfcA [Streptomyces pratensis]MCY1654976.1 sulfite exporter TauE/SafE family protein [Streptomyces sp. SL203]MCY1677698.1 sulfite exporter TauE/SafE family protein [Streptomyces sp. SL294]MDX2623327.1 sulfite exporter TauE/SafE family protein [Streptomyces sp. WI03-5b]MEE1777459.1 sulfite exporter TauE/SafE family protein [Streptomyces sp. JV181]